MKLFKIIVTKEIQVVSDCIRTCDVTGADTLFAAKIAMKTICDAFVNEGYAMHDSRKLSDIYSWIVFKKKNVTYEVQLTKAII